MLKSVCFQRPIDRVEKEIANDSGDLRADGQAVKSIA
jgi:hypothetical protein